MGQKDERGRAGEDRAVAYLRRQGYRILDRNWRVAAGEIDVVAAYRGVVVVCEVKTRRTSRFGHPLDAIDDAKRRRLVGLGRAWMAAHPAHRGRLRIDGISVLGEDAANGELEHVRGLA